MKKFETNNNRKQSQNSNNQLKEAADLTAAKVPTSVKAPKISVIIPVYNVEKYLSECLDSVLHQSLRETEVICVDDGSTDNSLEILHQYAAQDKRIKVLTQQNKGAGKARNSALKIATGKFVAFMDADDFYPSKHTLKNMYNAALKHHVLICGGSLNKIDNGELITDPQRFEDGYTFARNGYIKYKNYQFDYGYWRFIYDREFLTENQLYFPDYLRGQDPPFFIKAMSLAKEFYALKEATYVYRPNFKNVVWTERKAADCILSYTECLGLCLQYDYKELYNRIIKRMNNRTAIQRCFNFKSDKLVIDALKKLEQLHIDELSFIYRLETNVPAHISVIIPAYNVEPYLRECLDSVIYQTMPELEIICINDGSTDNSLAILQEYAAKDNRIKIIDQENQGLSCSRNNAMKIANGEYIMFLDSDDYIVLDACEKIYSRMKFDNLDMLSFSGLNFNNDTHEEYENNYWNFGYLPQNFNTSVFTYQDCRDFMPYMAVSSCLTVYKHDFIQRNNFEFPPHLCFEDNIFFLKALTNSERIGLMFDKLYRRRIHPASITQNWNAHFPDYVEISSKVLEYIEQFDTSLLPIYKTKYCNHLVNLYRGFNKQEKKQYRKIAKSFLKKYDIPLSVMSDGIGPKHVLSYKLLNFIPLFSYIQCGGRQVWKILGLPLWKIRRFDNNITTKYYLLGLPFIKVSKK